MRQTKGLRISEEGGGETSDSQDNVNSGSGWGGGGGASG